MYVLRVIILFIILQCYQCEFTEIRLFVAPHPSHKASCNETSPCSVFQALNRTFPSQSSVSLIFEHGTYDLSYTFFEHPAVIPQSVNILSFSKRADTEVLGNDVILQSTTHTPLTPLLEFHGQCLFKVSNITVDNFNRFFATQNTGEMTYSLSVYLTNFAMSNSRGFFQSQVQLHIKSLKIYQSIFTGNLEGFNMMANTDLTTLDIHASLFSENYNNSLTIINTLTQTSDVIFTVENSTFDMNTGTNGAGLAITNIMNPGDIKTENYYRTEVHVTDDTFTTNECTELGGAIYLNVPGFSVNIFGNVFRSNKAYRGAGVALTNAESVVIDTNLFVANLAQNDGFGGGVYSTVGATLSNTRFFTNFAMNGAAIYFDTTETVTLEHIQSRENHGDVAPGVYVENSVNLVIDDLDCGNNLADRTAGCFFYTSDGNKLATVKITNSVFQNNQGLIDHSVFQVIGKSAIYFTFENNQVLDNPYSKVPCYIKVSLHENSHFTNNTWSKNSGDLAALYVNAGDNGSISFTNEFFEQQNAAQQILDLENFENIVFNDVIFRGNLQSLIRINSAEKVLITHMKTESTSFPSNAWMVDLQNIRGEFIGSYIEFKEQHLKKYLRVDSYSIKLTNFNIDYAHSDEIGIQLVGNSIVFDSVVIKGCNVTLSSTTTFHANVLEMTDNHLVIDNEAISVVITNSFFHDGCGITLKKFSSFEIDNVSIQNNKPHGGITAYFYGNGESFIVKDSQINDNKNRFFGGGVVLHGSNSLGLISFDNFTVISDNKASYGGAIFYDLSTLSSEEYINNAGIIENNADFMGGGTYFNYFQHIDKKDIPGFIGRCDHNVAISGKCYSFPPDSFLIQHVTNYMFKCEKSKVQDHHSIFTLFDCVVSRIYIYDVLKNAITRVLPPKTTEITFLLSGNDTFSNSSDITYSDYTNWGVNFKFYQLKTVFVEDLKVNITMFVDMAKKNSFVINLKFVNSPDSQLKEIIIIVVCSTMGVIFFFACVMIISIIVVLSCKRLTKGKRVIGIISKFHYDDEEVEDTPYNLLIDPNVDSLSMYSEYGTINSGDQSVSYKPKKLPNYWNSCYINSSVQIMLNIPAFVMYLQKWNDNKVARLMFKFFVTPTKENYMNFLDFLYKNKTCKMKGESGEPQKCIERIVTDVSSPQRELPSFLMMNVCDVYKCDVCENENHLSKRNNFMFLQTPTEYKMIGISNKQPRKMEHLCSKCGELTSGERRSIIAEDLKIPPYLFVSTSESSDIDFENPDKLLEIVVGEGEKQQKMELFGIIFFQVFNKVSNTGHYSVFIKHQYFHDVDREKEMGTLKNKSAKKEKSMWYYCSDSQISECGLDILHEYFGNDEYQCKVLAYQKQA